MAILKVKLFALTFHCCQCDDIQEVHKTLIPLTEFASRKRTPHNSLSAILEIFVLTRDYLLITELFYSHIVNMNRGSFHTSFECSHLSGFTFWLIKHCFVRQKSFRSFRHANLAIRDENPV